MSLWWLEKGVLSATLKLTDLTNNCKYVDLLPRNKYLSASAMGLFF
jgi:hypothetical protein